MADGGRKHRILVVEDEDNIAIALDFLMTREGYDHDRIASGAGALLDEARDALDALGSGPRAPLRQQLDALYGR